MTEKMPTTPPKPSLVINVGLVGHLSERLPVGSGPHLEAEIGDVLNAINVVSEALCQEGADIFASSVPTLRLLSPLARGADQIGAKVGLEHGMELQAVLPFERKVFAEDFTDTDEAQAYHDLLGRASAVLELPGRPDRRPEAYEAAGFELLRRADILIAVWDGGKSGGRGGTTALIEQAIACQLPVIHIDATGKNPPQLLLADERIWPAVWQRLPLAELSRVLAGRLRPPEGADRAKLARFLAETERTICLRPEYPLLLCLLGIRLPKWNDIRHGRCVAVARDQSGPQLAVLGKAFSVEARDLWLGGYAYADRLAVRFAQIFRGSYILNFLFAALAVALALVGLLLPEWKWLFVAAETVLILTIVGNTAAGRQSGWHQRWLDYRHLAEGLRLLPITAIFGRVLLPRRGRADIGGDHSPGWIAWYHAALGRQMSVPNVGPHGITHIEARGILCEILRGQTDYHAKNSRELHHLDHWLHRAGTLLFWGTLAVSVLFLILKFGAPDVAGQVSKLVTFFTALLPAVGSALLGIRVQGDFKMFAERSTATSNRLREILTQVEQESDDQERLRLHAEDAARAMYTDLADWRQAFEGRPLDLPA